MISFPNLYITVCGLYCTGKRINTDICTHTLKMSTKGWIFSNIFTMLLSEFLKVCFENIHLTLQLYICHVTFKSYLSFLSFITCPSSFAAIESPICWYSFYLKALNTTSPNFLWPIYLSSLSISYTCNSHRSSSHVII